MLRRLLLLALVLCGVAHAGTQPAIELNAAPAWKGWARPGRVSEIDIRVTTDSAVLATIDVVAGRQTVRAELELQPGRMTRLHIPVSSVERIAVTAGSVGGSAQRREVVIAQSESPLLGVGLAAGQLVHLDGFHTVALAAQDLPRNASAYSSMDALILDAPTLGALDPQQLGALLAHAAACGRVAVVNSDAHVRHLLEGAASCGGTTLTSAATHTQATELLKKSLASDVPAAMSPGGIGELAQPDQVVWNRVAVALAVYLAAALLALMFVSSHAVLLLLPVLATVAALALPHAMHSASQLVVWSEGQSGARLARYQAWQRFTGLVRETMRVPLPPLLASSVQPCDLSQAMRLDFDAVSGRATFAEFETRLFGQALLCYSGSFPMARTLAIDTQADGTREIRNAGTTAWPHGLLLVAGRVHELPALAAHAYTTIGTPLDTVRRDAVMRTAMTRTQADGVAALWELELAGVAGIPDEAQGWLLVSVPRP